MTKLFHLSVRSLFSISAKNLKMLNQMYQEDMVLHIVGMKPIQVEKLL